MTFQELLERARGFQESRILLTAIELDLFTAVGEGAEAEHVAARLGTHPRATAMLLNALAAAGALTKSGSMFHNPPEIARHLVARSPDYTQPGLLHLANLWHAWSTLTDAVRQGTAVRRPGVEAHDERWTEAFIAAMHRNAAAAARRVAEAVPANGTQTLLDIGGGSGAYSIAFAQANPNLRATVFDIANVVPIAQRHIRDAGLDTRIRTAVGDLRSDEFGGPYDLVLVSAICHMLDESENLDLLRRCYRATSKGGRIIVRDFVVDEDRTAPKHAAFFALNMLVGTRGGSTYTESEYRSWLSEAGYMDFVRIRDEQDIMVARSSGI